QMGWTAGFFSFNTEGGRCDECKGEGTITVEMQFMSDLVLTCDACHGKRYKPDVLEARFNGKNIYDVLCMTVNAAVEFFGQHTADKGESGSICRRIVRRLKPLQQVGLGYITLGQSSSTLSGGENQRVKLAYHIGDERPRPTMFIFDEPTTGLHFHDTHRLLSAFNALIERGHTVICIEHNLDVTASADYVIDLGPEAGAGGGSLVACGTPEEIVAQGKGYTAHYLKNKLK
ncbi:MAG: excinuclease ABC subunit A, partial [Bacteroidaceae bacterium]|nr:excinuclease ABC subunit A [Bacteroidaceae bacterium]